MKIVINNLMLSFSSVEHKGDIWKNRIVIAITVMETEASK